MEVQCREIYNEILKSDSDCIEIVQCGDDGDCVLNEVVVELEKEEVSVD